MRVVDAINEAREYRELFVRMMMERYPIDKQEIERMRGEQRKAYGNNLDFLLMVRCGTNDKVNIHKPDATWKACLRDDEGESLIPGKARRIRGKSPLYLLFLLWKYLTGPGRWRGAVRAGFPKLAEGPAQQSAGGRAFPPCCDRRSWRGNNDLGGCRPVIFWKHAPAGQLGHGRLRLPEPRRIGEHAVGDSVLYEGCGQNGLTIRSKTPI